ncbi:MAG: hypothetical protein HY744_03490 [Deltaproteobacteria bacterium]|nr:hypothetical protein [Deltaproteobacteria bacterium]
MDREELFGELPPRATRAGLIDRFPPEASRAILAALSPADPEMLELELRPGAVVASRAGGVPALVLDDADPRAAGARALAAALGRYFTAADGFGPVARINFLDGVRVLFAGGDIAHLRPSGNAPQMRCFAVSDTQQRADEIVALAIREPDGLLRRMEREVRARAGAGVRTEVGP